MVQNSFTLISFLGWSILTNAVGYCISYLFQQHVPENGLLSFDFKYKVNKTFILGSRKPKVVQKVK